MRKYLVSTTALTLTLLAGMAVVRAAEVKTPAAATAPPAAPTTPTTTAPATTAVPAAMAPAGATTPAATMSGAGVAADKMIGRTVVNSSNEKVGNVESVLIDKDGKASYVILGVGGFLGMGERNVAVRWDSLSFADNNEKIVVNATKEQLSALPAHRFADPSWKGKVYAYDDDLKANPYLAGRPGTTLATPGLAVAPNAVDTKKLIGRDVKNPNGDTVGDINSVLIDKSGNVRYVVLGVGGFLGMGEKEVALAWDALTITANGDKVAANVTKEELKALPEFRYADKSRRGTVYSYDDDVKANPHLANVPTATTSAAPVAGANSFTESQARERIEANGYTAVTGLKKDEQSIWRGRAMKDGKSISVALDYKGNVVAQ